MPTHLKLQTKKGRPDPHCARTTQHLRSESVQRGLLNGGGGGRCEMACSELIMAYSPKTPHSGSQVLLGANTGAQYG